MGEWVGGREATEGEGTREGEDKEESKVLRRRGGTVEECRRPSLGLSRRESDVIAPL